MAPDEHQRAERLHHDWDAVLRGETPARPAGIDAIAAAVIARLGESAVSPYLASVQQRIRQQIVASAGAAELSAPQLPPVSGPQVRGRQFRPSEVRTSLRVIILAAVAVLALGLGLALGLFDLGRDDESHTIGPAIQAPATPSQEATPDDIVLNLTLPADSIPTG